MHCDDEKRWNISTDIGALLMLFHSFIHKIKIDFGTSAYGTVNESVFFLSLDFSPHRRINREWMREQCSGIRPAPGLISVDCAIGQWRVICDNFRIFKHCAEFTCIRATKVSVCESQNMIQLNVSIGSIGWLNSTDFTWCNLLSKCSNILTEIELFNGINNKRE